MVKFNPSKLSEPEAPKRVICNVHGPAGSGKTFTGCGIAMACAIVNGTKEVWHFDCERASGWIAERCRENGIKLVQYDASGEDFNHRTVEVLKGFIEAAPPNVPILVDQMTSVMEADQAAFYRSHPKIEKMSKGPKGGMAIGMARKRFKLFCEQVTELGRPAVFLARHGMEYGMVEKNGEKTEAPLDNKAKAGDLQYDVDFALYAREIPKKVDRSDTVRVHTFEVKKDRTGKVASALGRMVEFVDSPDDPAGAMKRVLKTFGPVVRDLMSGGMPKEHQG